MRELELIARERITANDFLTPAYAVTAAFLLSSETDSPVLAVIRDSLDARPYLPELTPAKWEDEAMGLVHELVRRRDRWGRERAIRTNDQTVDGARHGGS